MGRPIGNEEGASRGSDMAGSQAVAITLAALKMLFTERTDLLSCEGGAERSKKLILGG